MQLLAIYRLIAKVAGVCAPAEAEDPIAKGPQAVIDVIGWGTAGTLS